MSEFIDKYGPWALVTGAAEGLGAEFAQQLAQQGLSVVLADVQIEKAQAQAKRIADQTGVRAIAIECDLAAADFMDDLRVSIENLEIGMLVCCAGIGATGSFIDTPLAVMHKAIQVNCMATVALTHHITPAMVERGRGGVIIVASNSAYTGAPYIANYAATKAFDLSLAEGLWYEMAPSGVDVLGFSPQGTNTPGMRRGMPMLNEGDAPEGIMLPEEAVSIALRGLGRLPSLRPDLPEQFSENRRAVIEAAGGFTKNLAAYKGE